MDSNWINNSLHLYENNTNFFQTSQSSIKSLFIYVNIDNSIDKVVSNLIDISNNFISKNDLLNIIIRNKISTPQFTFNFDYLSLFSIPIQHDKISDFNSSYFNYSQFITNHSINQDFYIPKTLNIFHKFNTLFFFFKKRLIQNLPKSILITPSKKNCPPKKTKKKVTIVEHKFRKTKKSI